MTTLSTDIFMDRIGKNYYYYYATTPLFWIMITTSIVYIISSIFLAIGTEKVSLYQSKHLSAKYYHEISQENIYMFVPWMVVHAITLTPFIPIIVVVLLCAAVACKS